MSQRNSTDSPTWRQALQAAQDNYREAIENRRVVARLAHDAGLSVRQIAEGCGISPSAAYALLNRDAGRRERVSLDAEANSV